MKKRLNKHSSYYVTTGTVCVLVLIELLLMKSITSSSIESCLSAYGVNLTETYDPNIILPIECLCSEEEIICTNSKINNPSLPNDSDFPSLYVLFLQENSTLYYLLPKQRLTFWGYKSLKPNSFRNFKFVNRDGYTQFGTQNVYLYFSEVYRFPTGTFDSLGNLADLDQSVWPKIRVEIIDNDLVNMLNLEPASFHNMTIESLSVKYAGPATYIQPNAFQSSTVNRFEIKNSARFVGFGPLTTDLNVTVRNLIIDDCANFVLDNTTLPAFDQLNYLTVKSCGIVQVPNNIWSKFDQLVGLSLIGNQITYVDAANFNGIEPQLVLLDLSYNPITNLDWNLMPKLVNLKTLDLSYTLISTINSYVRVWPNPGGLQTVVLKGYNNTFDNRTICTFDYDVTNGKIDLTKTFVQVDRTYQCDCFVFYIYKDYRLNPANSLSDWMLAERTPQCYQDLYTAAGNFSLIEQQERACNFVQLLATYCPRTSSVPISYDTSTTSTPCLYTQSSQPGMTSVTIGGLTTVSITPCVTSSVTYQVSSESSTLSPVSSSPYNPSTMTSQQSSSLPTNYSTVHTTHNDNNTSPYTNTDMFSSSNAQTGSDTSSSYQSSASSNIVTNSDVTTTGSTSIDRNHETSSTSAPCSSFTALPTLNSANSNGLNTTSTIIIAVLGAVSLALLLIILGLIIYFRNKLRSIGQTQLIDPTTSASSSSPNGAKNNPNSNKSLYRV